MTKPYRSLLPNLMLIISMCIVLGTLSLFSGVPLSHTDQNASIIQTEYSSPSLPRVADPNDFISQWLTSGEGISDSNQVKLPLESNGTYDFEVDWGDSSPVDRITMWDQPETTHTYASSGWYTIVISGVIEGWRFNEAGDTEKIGEVQQWGCLELGNSGEYFAGCRRLRIAATDSPDLTNTTSMRGAFQRCGNLGTSGNLNSWNVSHITDMAYMFHNTYSFNQPLDSWEVSSVTDMNHMFDYIYDFNQSLNSWDISNVTDMSSMFEHTYNFNQPLDLWDVSSVTDMSRLFIGANFFNQSISSWDVSSVTDMSWMFGHANSFNQPLDSWDVSSVTDMRMMFYSVDCFNQPLGSWDVSSVTGLGGMFHHTNFNHPIGSWDVSSVTDMGWMFGNTNYFNQSLDSWDVSSVTNMYGMFGDAYCFNQPLGSWNVSRVTNMHYMFQNAISFNQPLGSWNVSSVTEMRWIFRNVTLSTENYDNLLIGWSQLPLQKYNHLDGGNSTYSSAAAAARQYIIDNYGWFITDGGLVEEDPLPDDTIPGYNVWVVLGMIGCCSIYSVIFLGGKLGKNN